MTVKTISATRTDLRVLLRMVELRFTQLYFALYSPGLLACHGQLFDEVAPLVSRHVLDTRSQPGHARCGVSWILATRCPQVEWMELRQPNISIAQRRASHSMELLRKTFCPTGPSSTDPKHDRPRSIAPSCSASPRAAPPVAPDRQHPEQQGRAVPGSVAWVWVTKPLIGLRKQGVWMFRVGRHCGLGSGLDYA